MCWTVYEIKIEFYEMTRKILNSFTNRDILTQFKGSETKSAHMDLFMGWYKKQDIFQILDKTYYKERAKTFEGFPLYQEGFHQRLIYYPTIKNFVSSKYFPNSVEDNIRQLYALPNTQVKDQRVKKFEKGKEHQRTSKETTKML